MTDFDAEDIWDAWEQEEQGNTVSKTTRNPFQCINKSCPANKPEDYIIEHSYPICLLCDTMQQGQLDEGAEWKTYNTDTGNGGGDTSRCGISMSQMFPNMSLGSIVSKEGGGTGNMFNVARYKNWSSITYKETSIYKITDYINRICLNHNISQIIIKHANKLYYDISQKCITRGNNRKGIIAACLYISCKHHNAPRSKKEIAKLFEIEVSIITKGCKDFYDIIRDDIKTTTPQDYLERFCSRLDLTDRYIDLCKNILEMADKYNIICESAASSITTGVIYFVTQICKIDITKKDIEVNCFISAVTINKCYKKLYDNRKYLIRKKIREAFKDIIIDVNCEENKKNRKGRKPKNISRSSSSTSNSLSDTTSITTNTV